MKSLTTKITIAAAALLVAAGTISAQSLTAEIPFNFQVAGTPMTAGSYRLTTSASGTPLIALSNLETDKSAMVMGQSRIDYTRNSEAKLVFQCRGANCALKQVWTGTWGKNFEVPVPHSRDRELAAIRVLSVRLQ